MGLEKDSREDRKGHRDRSRHGRGRRERRSGSRKSHSRRRRDSRSRSRRRRRSRSRSRQKSARDSAISPQQSAPSSISALPSSSQRGEGGGEVRQRKSKWDDQVPAVIEEFQPPMPIPQLMPQIAQKVLRLKAVQIRCLIGKGGQTINALCQTTGADIKVLHKIHDPEGDVVIRGDVERGMQGIRETLIAKGCPLREPGTMQNDDEIEVPSELMKFFIGAKGSNIKEMKEKAEAGGGAVSIQIMPPTVEGGPQKVQVAGDNIPLAKQLVREKLEEARRHLAMDATVQDTGKETEGTGKLIHIAVQLLSGRTLQVPVPLASCVDDLRQEVSTMLSTPALQVRLAANGELLLGGASVQTVMNKIVQAILVAPPQCVCVLGGGDTVGGKGTCSAEHFSLEGGDWQPLPPMAQQRVGANAAVLNKSLYVCGGHNNYGTGMNSVEVFNPNDRSWTSAPAMIEKRSFAAAAVIDGHLYICGGRTDSGYGMSSVEMFNVMEQAWETLPNMIEKRAFAAAASVDGLVYVCGGEYEPDEAWGWDGGDAFAAGGLTSVERYDPAIKSWSPIAPMHDRRALATAATIGCFLYVCGGEDDVGHKLNSVERYDSMSGRWERMPPMMRRRIGASAAMIGGVMYICGGRNDGAHGLSSAEMFDPETGQWEVLPHMTERRFGAAAVAMVARF